MLGDNVSAQFGGQTVKLLASPIKHVYLRKPVSVTFGDSGVVNDFLGINLRSFVPLAKSCTIGKNLLAHNGYMQISK